MPRAVSAGVLAWRAGDAGPEFLLVHPGGPYWRGKDTAAWSIPKGVADADEDLLVAACREFEEELGQPIDGAFEPLTPIRQPGGKMVHAWLIEADLDLSTLKSNQFELEWPPGSGKTQLFPEVDQAVYFPAASALLKAHRGQRPILDEALQRIVGRRQP